MQCLTTYICDLCKSVKSVISSIFLICGFGFYFVNSVEHSGGQRVRLELQKLSQFSVFPGQV